MLTDFIFLKKEDII